MSILDSLAVDAESGAAEMNRMAESGIPFVFVVDAWAERWVVRDFPGAARGGILWDLDGEGPMGSPHPPKKQFRFQARTVSRETYRRGFNIIRRAQERGESWLANLTYPSSLDTDLSLEQLAFCSRAPFRLYVPGQLTVFSPERFVSIYENGRISTFPMKGTIETTVSNARDVILADEKEKAEHITVVDLLRNDIGMVATEVSVPRYRFISEIRARGRHLLQVSSEISGSLGRDWRKSVGSVLTQLLPAGSVTGAPKKRTGEIIREAEGYNRGWYTGVFGVFDGRRLDSAVMIRFVEQSPEGRLVYKSGGGITIYSDLEAEYAELGAKIYAPFS